MFDTRPSWSWSPPTPGYDKCAAEGHFSWRIQLSQKREEDHSDIREVIGESSSIVPVMNSSNPPP